MKLNDLKIKRLTEAKALRRTRTEKAMRTTRRLTTDEKGRQVYVDQRKDESEDDDEVGGTLDEGAKKHHTPKFVQHCVSAITQDSKKLADVQSKKNGSPFAICNAQYNKNKSSLAAKHSTGEHHSVSDYERSLAKLREDVVEARQQRADRRYVVFSDVQLPVESSERSQVRYVPKS